MNWTGFIFAQIYNSLNLFQFYDRLFANEYVRLDWHGFSDATINAYAACVCSGTNFLSVSMKCIML